MIKGIQRASTEHTSINNRWFPSRFDHKKKRKKEKKTYKQTAIKDKVLLHDAKSKTKLVGLCEGCDATCHLTPSL